MRVTSSLRLYTSNRAAVMLVPIYILLALLGISILIALVVGINAGLPLPESVSDKLAQNLGAVFSLPGFMVSLGVLAVNRNFAMALAFGTTRREFWLGQALGFLLTTLATSSASLVLLVLERVTDHWFIGARAFDVAPMGNGSYPKTFAMIAMLSLLSLFLGAFFGTVYRAFGATATTLVGVILGVVLVGAVAVGVWQWDRVLPWLVEMGIWGAFWIGMGVSAVAAVLSYLANRVATV